MTAFLKDKSLDTIVKKSPLKRYFPSYRPGIKENTMCVIATCQNNVLLLWHTIQNHTLWHVISALA